MSEERIRALLQRADETAGEPAFGPIVAAEVRRRIRQRLLLRIAAPVSIAAVLLVAMALMGLRTQQPVQPHRVVSLEARIEQLQAQTDATLRLVQEVVERDRQERRLAALHAELANIPDPMQEIERQVDKTAFVLVYQADKLYKELNRTESAVRAYKEVIRLFPENRWADVARERVCEIEQRQVNPSGKGEPTCEPHSV